MREDLETLKRALIVADRDLALAATNRLVEHGADPKWLRRIVAAYAYPQPGA